MPDHLYISYTYCCFIDQTVFWAYLAILVDLRKGYPVETEEI